MPHTYKILTSQSNYQKALEYKKSLAQGNNPISAGLQLALNLPPDNNKAKAMLATLNPVSFINGLTSNIEFSSKTSSPLLWNNNDLEIISELTLVAIPDQISQSPVILISQLPTTEAIPSNEVLTLLTYASNKVEKGKTAFIRILAAENMSSSKKPAGKESDENGNSTEQKSFELLSMILRAHEAKLPNIKIVYSTDTVDTNEGDIFELRLQGKTIQSTEINSNVSISSRPTAPPQREVLVADTSNCTIQQAGTAIPLQAPPQLILERSFWQKHKGKIIGIGLSVAALGLGITAAALTLSGIGSIAGVPLGVASGTLGLTAAETLGVNLTIWFGPAILGFLGTGIGSYFSNKNNPKVSSNSVAQPPNGPRIQLHITTPPPATTPSLLQELQRTKNITNSSVDSTSAHNAEMDQKPNNNIGTPIHKPGFFKLSQSDTNTSLDSTDNDDSLTEKRTASPS